MTINRQPDETVNEYIVRLYDIKEEQGFQWKDIAENVLAEFDIYLTPEAVRKRCSRIIRQTVSCPVEEKISENTELYQLRTERTQLRNYYNSLSREETIQEIGIEAAKQLVNNYPLLSQKSSVLNSVSNDTAILLIGDWHYGVQINSPYNIYNPDVCKERVNNLYSEVLSILKQNNINKLTVINLGDMIAGNIKLQIRIASQEDVISQTISVSEIIAQFLHNLSNHVKELNYYSTLDNHSRIDPDKKHSVQLETFARITPWFLKERLKDCSNIIIHDNTEYGNDIVSFKQNGYNIMAVHGDKDKQNNVINNLTLFSEEHQDLICTGHYHHFSSNENHRTMLICNGSLMGTDEYAMSLRLNGNPSQTMIIVSNRNVCKCIYKIDLNSVDN